MVLFGAVELLQWVQQVSLPMPVFVVGGVFLAIASNYDKFAQLSLPRANVASHGMPKEIASQSVSPFVPSPVAKGQPAQSISFEIQKPFQPGD